MTEYDIKYFDLDLKRKVPERTIHHRMVAWRRGHDLYDGDREYGYGGFNYDGRWQRMIPEFVKRYGLSKNSSVLDVGCKKGFFLHDMKEMLPGITVKGIEDHPYPIENAMETVKDDIQLADLTKLPFDDGAFDFVLAFSAIYILPLGGVMKALAEIQRVGGGNSYVTLGAYRNDEEKRLFERWSLLGTTVLHVDEWKQVFEEVGYTGDYYFTTASSLNLQG